MLTRRDPPDVDGQRYRPVRHSVEVTAAGAMVSPSARRLLPNLPRCSLRALAGYFGRAVGALRRSGDHVDATAFVWQEQLKRLIAVGAPVALRLGAAPALDASRTASALWWV